MREKIEEDNKLLTPLSISCACPGLYWSMVNKFKKDYNKKPNSMDEVLRCLFPKSDWKHLEHGGGLNQIVQKQGKTSNNRMGMHFMQNVKCHQNQRLARMSWITPCI